MIVYYADVIFETWKYNMFTRQSISDRSIYTNNILKEITVLECENAREKKFSMLVLCQYTVVYSAIP